jgi:hypothetical protein
MQTELVKLTEKQTVAVYSTDDVEPYLEQNKLLRSMHQPNTDGLKHVASVPNIIMVKWLNEAWQRGQNVRYLSPEWDDIVKTKLADPEWAYLRVDAPRHRVGYGS